jgi:hypothetical protein
MKIYKNSTVFIFSMCCTFLIKQVANLEMMIDAMEMPHKQTTPTKTDLQRVSI